MLRQLSIRQKLQLIIVSTSGVVLFLAAVVFAINNSKDYQRNLKADANITVDLIGLATAAGVVFLQPDVVEQTLQNLNLKTNLMSLYIFDNEGVLVSFYQRQGDKKLKLDKLQDYYQLNFEASAFDLSTQTLSLFQENHLDMFKPLLSTTGKTGFQETSQVGTIFARFDTKELTQQHWKLVKISGLIFILCLFLAYILSLRLHLIITKPIERLLAIIDYVAKNKDYSIRGTKLCNDELGALMSGFNHMLAQIEQRNLKLEEYHNSLEDKVKVRTQELAEARDHALAANQAKSIFLANMSHEIRTPMNAILGYAQILQRDSQLNVEQRENIQIIENSGNHLLALINDILDLSKIEAGAMALNLEQFNLFKLIRNVASMFSIQCENKGLEWRVAYQLPENLLLYGDQGKLRQILINLLGNAVKFTQQGHVLLQVDQVATMGKHQNQYRFLVKDTGRGISQTAQQRIFEPFQQETLDPNQGGTGLGLAISKRQVDLMAGEIYLQSSPQQGSCFTVLLPLVVKQATETAERIEQPIKTVHLADGEKVNALVVDDIKENRDILAKILRDIGANVYSAADGEQALALIKQQPLDIVFSDIRMPKVDGIALIHQLKQDNLTKNLPCIAISASTLLHQNQNVLAAGYDNFIAKPFEFSAIYRCLADYLQVQFVYTRDEKPTTAVETTQNGLKFVQLPCDLYHRLQTAAQFNELTEMEILIEALRQGDLAQQQLADQLQLLLNQYDIEGILRQLTAIDCLDD